MCGTSSLVFALVVLNCIWMMHTAAVSIPQEPITTVATPSNTTNQLKGRFLDALLKPLRKVWRVYVLRTVLPSVMGVKLMVLVPTLAMVMTLLEGALAAAAFFYVLFTTAVAGPNTDETYSTHSSFPWSVIQTFIDTPDSLDSFTPPPTLHYYLPSYPNVPAKETYNMNVIPLNHLDMLNTQATSTETYSQADSWQQAPPYYTGVANTYNNSIYGTSNVANPFVSYYSTYGEAKQEMTSENDLQNTQQLTMKPGGH